MKKKIILWVMPVILLAFGLALSGCELVTEVTLINDSSHTVVVTMPAGEGWDPSRISLAPGTRLTTRTREEGIIIKQPEYTSSGTVSVFWNTVTNTFTFNN